MCRMTRAMNKRSINNQHYISRLRSFFRAAACKCVRIRFAASSSEAASISLRTADAAAVLMLWIAAKGKSKRTGEKINWCIFVPRRHTATFDCYCYWLRLLQNSDAHYRTLLLYVHQYKEAYTRAVIYHSPFSLQPWFSCELSGKTRSRIIAMECMLVTNNCDSCYILIALFHYVFVYAMYNKQWYTQKSKRDTSLNVNALVLCSKYSNLRLLICARIYTYGFEHRVYTFETR